MRTHPFDAPTGSVWLYDASNPEAKHRLPRDEEVIFVLLDGCGTNKDKEEWPPELRAKPFRHAFNLTKGQPCSFCDDSRWNLYSEMLCPST